MLKIDGCGLMCVSHVTKISPSVVKSTCESLGVNDEYLDDKEVAKAVRWLGMKATRLLNKTINYNERYIVTVPSLNNVGGFHFVVLTGTTKGVRVWDPNGSVSNKKSYVGHNKTITDKNRFIRITSWTNPIKINK